MSFVCGQVWREGVDAIGGNVNVRRERPEAGEQRDVCVKMIGRFVRALVCHALQDKKK